MYRERKRITPENKRVETKTIEEIKTILVFVEMNDGKIRQVLAGADIKKVCLHLMKTDGILKVTEEVMPIEISKHH